MGGKATLPGNRGAAGSNFFNIWETANRLKKEGHKGFGVLLHPDMQQAHRTWFASRNNQTNALGGGQATQQEGISPEEQQRKKRNTAGGFFGTLGG